MPDRKNTATVRYVGDMPLLKAVLCALIALSLWPEVSRAEGEKLDMRQYWPQPNAEHVLIVRFDSGRLSLYRRTGDTFTLTDCWHRYTDADEASTLVVGGTWHYRMNPVEGVVEFQDDSPGIPPTPLRKGYEIKWGNQLAVGQTIEHKVIFAGASAPFGYHRLTLAEHLSSYNINGTTFKDVIRLEDLQDVCKDSVATADQPGRLDCPNVLHSHATYYLAKSYGIVQIVSAVFDGAPDFVPAESAAKICQVGVNPGHEYCK